MSKLISYAQWCEVFNKIENWEIGHTDSEIINAIDNGTIDWVSGVAERFTNQLLTLINKRFTKLETFYNARIKTCYDQFNLSNLLILFRKELVFLKHLANIPAIPESVSKQIVKEIKDYAENGQKSLLESAKKDLSGSLKQIILDIKINNI